LAAHLRFAGATQVTIWNRSPLDSKRNSTLTLELPENPHYPAFFQGPLPTKRIARAALIILTVADTALAGMAERLLAEVLPAPACPVLHTSGALPAHILSPLSAAGIPIGSMHPLKSFAGIPRKNDLSHTLFALEGHPEAIEAARQVVSWVKGDPRILKPEDKKLYHTSAVMASNLLVALVSIATEMLGKATTPEDSPETTLGWLLPLIEGTVENLRTQGLPGALTGPVSRGDVAIVAQHMRAIKEQAHISGATAGDPLTIYRELSLQALELARKQGLPHTTCQVMANLLRPQPSSKHHPDSVNKE